MEETINNDPCPTTYVLAINDTMNVLQGKWKLPILGALLFGKMRFLEMEKIIPKITSRMLSKELKDLEMSGIVTRTVYDTKPVSVVYELSKSGESFKDVLDTMIKWGTIHREEMMKK